MAERQYLYVVTGIERIVDGDTYWLHLDVGFRQNQLTCIRLMGYDCPERVGGSKFEHDKADEATMAASAFFVAAEMIRQPVWCRTEKDPDNFGRWLGELWYEGESKVFLGAYLAGQKLATPWPIRWRTVYDRK